MTLPQPVRFVLVGAGGYAVNLGAFAALLRSSVPYVVASVAAYFVANALMYVGNRYFTFRLGHAGILGAYARYMAAGALVVAASAVQLAVLVELIAVPPTVAQAIALVLVTPLAFVLNRRSTFRLVPVSERS
jgi:putative flippase GtrA